MSNKTTLFVCQSCRIANSEASDCPAEGAKLLQHLQNAQEAGSQPFELDIQATGCLWTCEHPCAIALSSPDKSTYVLAKISVAEGFEKTAEAILHFSQLYSDSKDGTIPWKQFPEVLQTEIVARVPPISPLITQES
jgi:predicted metal-binding protein